MTEHDSNTQPNASLAPLNFVFACSVCCLTIADAYEGREETVQGLSDGINPKDRLVARIYLASCCHVFCGKHLEGGAPPFHPAGQRPKAACPVCVKEKSDATPRDLFSIRGFYKDEYDPSIPAVWFTTPPVSLDGKGKEMEALRFQYLALVRYCQSTYAARKPTSDALSVAQMQLEAMQSLASEEHAKALSLQQENEQLRATQAQINDLSSLRAEVERLQGLEHEVGQARADIDSVRQLKFNLRELETFKENKAAIKHYLKLVPFLIEQNQKMKERLASLGFAMALEPIPNSPKLSPAIFEEYAEPKENHPVKNRWFRTPTSTRTRSRLGNNISEQLDAPQDRPAKRQRIDSPIPRNMQINLPSSRDAMPPPPKPLSRINSMRKIIPSLRKKFSHNCSMPTPDQAFGNDNDADMSGDGYWGSATTTQDRDKDYHIPTKNGIHDGQSSMSEALSVEPQYGLTDPRESGLLRSVGIPKDRSDFTFRAVSPVKTDVQMHNHLPAQLPTESSYMRIMDGLSHDTNFEIGLKDPRENSTRQFGTSSEQDAYNSESQPQSLESQRWSLGDASQRRSLKESSLRSSRVYSQRTAPITPAPKRNHHLGQRVDSVVSPFFRTSHPDTRVSSGIRITEPRNSSMLSSTYQSPNPHILRSSSKWHEPIGLNGLSFFESPVNSRNEPIQPRHTERLSNFSQPPRHYQNRNFGSNSFFVRPETRQYSSVRDYAPASHFERHPGSQIQHTQPQSAIPFPSSTYGSSSQSRQLSSAVPQTISGRSPMRYQHHWEPLQPAGVRSSRQINTAGQNKFHLGSRFPSANPRRSIRR